MEAANATDSPWFHCTIGHNYGTVHQSIVPPKTQTMNLVSNYKKPETQTVHLHMIISYESRDGLSGANYDKAVKILSGWADGHKLT